MWLVTWFIGYRYYRVLLVFLFQESHKIQLLFIQWSNILILNYVPAAKQENDSTCDLDLDDPELEKAATRIQASFRGHNTRKQLKPPPKMAEGEEVIDIDLNDPGKIPAMIIASLVNCTSI